VIAKASSTDNGVVRIAGWVTNRTNPITLAQQSPSGFPSRITSTHHRSAAEWYRDASLCA
jgi:hypothetical protein